MMDNPFGDLIPQSNMPQASGGNPFHDLIPSAQQSKDLPLSAKLVLGTEALKKSIPEGLRDAGRGIKQLGLQGAEYVGLQPEGATADYTKQVDAERKAFQDSPLAKSMPKTTAVGELIGNTAPSLLIPGGMAGKLATRIGTGALAGGAIGASQYVPEGQSRAFNTAVGASTGGVLPTLGAAGSKVINAVRGGTESPEAQALIQQGLKHDVPVYAGDATKNPLLKGISNGLEDVPLIGSKGERFAQMQKAQTAAQNVTDQLKQSMLNSKFDIGDLQKLANDPIRGKAAQKILQDLSSSGDDWQKIIENSGNLKSFQSKLIADDKYSKVTQLANKYGAVDKEHTLGAISNAVKEASDSVLPDTSLVNTLQTLGNNIGSKNLNYSQMRQARSEVGSLISDYYKGKNAIVGGQGVGHLQSIKNAIDKDMNGFAQKNGPELKTAWQDADKYYRSAVIPYKDVQLAKALTNAAPDEIYSKFIARGDVEGGKGTSRALKLYNALDDKGRSAVRYGMASSALEKAINRDAGTFSPAIFASELDRLSAAKGVFFKGEAKAEIDGFRNLMRGVERSKIAVSKPETGVKAIPWVAGILGFGAHAAGATGADLGLSAAGVYGIKKLMTTNTGRRLLLASSKLKVDSPAMQKAVDAASRIMQRGAVVEATQPFDQNGGQ